VAKYASVYTRAHSPYWWISFWCPRRQKRCHESTTYRRDQVQGKRRALDLANEKSKIAGADKSEKGQDRWERWVEDFLAQRYPGENRAKTRVRMIGGWKQWREFLTDTGLRIPRALTYENVLAFVKWRSSQVKPSSGKVVSKNTALCDVRIMAVVMREACRRGFADGNPCDRLGITKDPSKEKPEMTDAEIDKIRDALKSQPEWMQVSFEIGIHQGCRLTETAVPWHRIDLDNDQITFVAKGRNGRPHEFTTKIHPGLKPLLRSLKTKNPESKTTCTLPSMAAKDWHFFFQGTCLPHLCFHCTRVTVVTRMARAGVPIQQAMAFVGHASEVIHKVYQRLKPADTGNAVAAINPGTAAALPTPVAHSNTNLLMQALLSDPVIKQRMLSLVASNDGKQQNLGDVPAMP